MATILPVLIVKVHKNDSIGWLRDCDREQTGVRNAEAELHRLKGELLMIKDLGNVAEAERSLRTAINVARRQGARLFEIRATVSIGRLRHECNRADEAHTMLAEIYNWFTEGFDTPDLKDAKARLDELAT
jgi:predicted ATPase